MTDHNFLTVHSITAIPLHNRNRDDRGQPKQLREGNVARGVLSNQSLKRISRVNYERAAADIGPHLGSVRSKSIPAAAVKRAGEIAAAAGVPFDPTEALARATETVTLLTTNNAKQTIKLETKLIASRAAHERKAKPDTDLAEYMKQYDDKLLAKQVAAAENGEKPTSLAKETVVYLSAEEIEALALALVANSGDIGTDDVFRQKTGSLALASFGRMTANAPGLQIEAGIAVSPATTTHAIVVNIDYLTAVDDLATKGAAHMDQAFYTSGVYYRSVTYDRRQLLKNWTGWESSVSDTLLTELVRDITLSLPQGRKNGAAADTLPSVLIAEQQRSRTGYQFQSPVQARDGGYLEPSIDDLYAQATAARLFDPSHFGPTVVSGVGAVGQASRLEGAAVVNMDDMTAFIVKWLRS